MRNCFTKKIASAVVLLISIACLSPVYGAWTEEVVVQGGGVVTDLCLLDIGSYDQLWAASMAGGVFSITRSNEPTSGAWGNWTTYPILKDRSCLAIDALRVSDVTKVISGCGGVYYKDGDNSFIRPSGWNTTDLRQARVTAVAFYYGQTAFSKDHFYFTRQDEVDTGLDGIYRYNDGVVTRIISTSASNCFSRIYRDNCDPTILYFIKSDAQNTYSHLYRLRCDDYAFGNETFDDFALSTENVLGIQNLSQYNATQYYMSVTKADGSNAVWYGNPAVDEEWEEIYNMGEPTDEIFYPELEGHRRVVGKYDSGNNQHHLWIFGGQDGVKYVVLKFVDGVWTADNYISDEQTFDNIPEAQFFQLYSPDFNPIKALKTLKMSK